MAYRNCARVQTRVQTRNVESVLLYYVRTSSAQVVLMYSDGRRINLRFRGGVALSDPALIHILFLFVSLAAVSPFFLLISRTLELYYVRLATALKLLLSVGVTAGVLRRRDVRRLSQARSGHPLVVQFGSHQQRPYSSKYRPPFILYIASFVYRTFRTKSFCPYITQYFYFSILVSHSVYSLPSHRVSWPIYRAAAKCCVVLWKCVARTSAASLYRS